MDNQTASVRFAEAISVRSLPAFGRFEPVARLSLPADSQTDGALGQTVSESLVFRTFSAAATPTEIRPRTVVAQIPPRRRPTKRDPSVSVLPHVILLPDASQEMLLRSFSLLRILFSGKAPCSLPPKVAEGRCQDDSPITIALRRHSGSFLCCRRLAASQPRGATPAVVAAS
jgi:hypothetical protein